MKDYDRDVFGPLNEIVYTIQELHRRQVVATRYMATDMIIVTDVDHQIVFVGLFVALDDLCEVLDWFKLQQKL